MMIWIKRHVLLLLIVGICSYILGYCMTDSLQELEVNNALANINQTDSTFTQFAYLQDMVSVTTNSYTHIYWLMVLLFTGLANGFYMVLSWVRVKQKSQLFVFLAFFFFPIVGIAGVVTLLPLVAYELYHWIIKKEKCLYFGVSDELKEREEMDVKVQYANDQQAQLLKRYMRIYNRNIGIFLIIIIPLLIFDFAFLINFSGSGGSIFIFLVVLFIILLGGMFVFTIIQSKNVELMNTYIESGETALLKESYEIIMDRCKNDTFNATERAAYLNVLLLNGDYEEAKTLLKGKLIAKRSPIRWLCEYRFAMLDHDESIFEENIEKLRNYYQRMQAKNPSQKAEIDIALLDLDIRKDMFYNHYDDALTKVLTKSIPEKRLGKLTYYYQLGMCYYHTNRLDEAKENFLMVQELSPTSELSKEISPLLSTLM